MPLVLIMKDKVEELSNIGIAIGTGDEEVIDEGATTGGDRTVGESFGFCCPGVEPEFFAESTNALLFSLISPMNIIFYVIALTDIPSQSSGIISILKITLLTYCSQVNYKGAVRRHQKNVHRLPPSLSRPLSELDFCLRPIPHLGACSG